MFKRAKDIACATMENDVFLLILLLVAFFPYLYMSYYIHPSGDDFSYAWISWQNTFADAFLREYMMWSGRYSSNIFFLLNPIAFGSFSVYKAMPVVVLLLSIVATYCFSGLLSGSVFSKVQRWLATLVLHLLFLNNMPDLAEGLYWYTALVAYQLGNCFFLVFLILWGLYVQKRYVVHKVLHFVFVSFLLLFVIGFNEVLMVLSLVFCVAMFFLAWAKQFLWKSFALSLAFVALTGASVMIFAPGNGVRSGFFPHRHEFFYSVVMASAQTARFLFDWLNSLALAIVSLVYYPANKKLVKIFPIFRQSFYFSPVFAIFLVLFIVFMGSFPAYYATGMLGQHRTVNLVYFLFLIVWFVLLTVLYNKLNVPLPVVPRIVRRCALFLAVVLLCFSNNGYLVISDIKSGRAKVFDAEMKRRYEVLQSSQDTVWLPAIKERPESIFVYDIGADGTHWHNVSYSKYFTGGRMLVMKK